MIKIFEMFSGYGGASFALKKAMIPFVCVGFSEIDKYAIQCYNQNHLNVRNFGDCKQINPTDIPDFDLLTGGFPCQDVSIAGKRDLNKGRTNLYLEILRILKAKKPKYALLENVKGLLSMVESDSKNSLLIHKIIRDLGLLGYGVCWKVLNSKNHGIPQNRERVWIVCKLGGWDFMEFQFPIKEKLEISLKDILELEVDKKYYLSEKLQAKFNTFIKEKYLHKGKVNSLNQIASIKNQDITNNSNSSKGARIYSSEGIATTLSSNGGGLGGKTGIYAIKNSPCIGTIEIDCNKRVMETPVEINQYLKDNKNLFSISELSRKLDLPKTQVEHYFRLDKCRAIPSPEVWLKLKEILHLDDTYDKAVTSTYNKLIEFEQTRRVYGTNGVSPTLNTIHEPIIYNDTWISNSSKREFSINTNHSPIISNTITTAVGRIGHSKEELCYIENNVKCGQLRRLTPKECFRLMGFLKDEINLDGLSDTQRYKLAGNGWDINLVSKIMLRLFKND